MALSHAAAKHERLAIHVWQNAGSEQLIFVPTYHTIIVMTIPVLKGRYTVLDEEARYWCVLKCLHCISFSHTSRKDEELELQIAFHTQRAAQLKRLLNSRRCISRKLPPEILAEVFLFQAVILRAERIAQHLEEGSAATHRSFYKWINVAQVCHHWREVALNCAALWTWFAFEEHIADSFLNLLNDRTRDLPVTVVLTINPPKQRCDACIDINMFSERGFHSIAMIKSLFWRFLGYAGNYFTLRDSNTT